MSLSGYCKGQSIGKSSELNHSAPAWGWEGLGEAVFSCTPLQTVVNHRVRVEALTTVIDSSSSFCQSAGSPS